MVFEAQFVLVLLSIFVLLSVIVALFGCVCGCRKTVPKPNNTVTSATRSLPDLPVESQRTRGRSADVLWEAAEPNGDTSSELYATVDDNKHGRGGGPNGKLPRDSTIESSYDSPSQTDNSLSPYARVKREHPYDQVKQSDEHPYAHVKANNKAGPSHAPDPVLPLSESSSSSSSEDEVESPVAPPRSRKSVSLSQSSLSSTVDIPAATAIAGGIPANHELPYMTPPLPINTQQQHFSGDSQDSSKGYTSISVREPLSNILGQVTRRQDLIDSHYATVSDDSDEMYAAIEEPNQPLYTSGSETYAQIRPAAAVSLQPPSHPLPPAGNNHSRQESWSSTGSPSTSPKPEKRQANSPLPRPPDAPTVDDMYAKVVKKQRSTVDLVESVQKTELPGYETVQRSQSPAGVVPGYETVASNCAGYETVAGELDSLVPGYERVAPSDCEPNYEELRPQDGCDATYATVEKKRSNSRLSNSEPDYASLLRKDPGHGDPNYETVCRDSDPNYESVECQDPPYERVSVPLCKQENGVVRSEDVYSQVNKHRTVR
ncbi:uncharacterized protein LOC124361931 isoform X2 [Homalodisca vitripennis]|uniref:uncharacterized protein LOC124361931 isoform X2 n=1 Tax=Homalodisca vitripennis TaxID=197043 RepID=UPI001EEB488B|nr:uncharacterized protein LOC124361931 isoform X2 [Homalodisca vitripennis]XP_046671956.1 uncharacterized protein LOC124361931 isoform X2 [Homalodisca vitripennis]